MGARGLAIGTALFVLSGAAQAADPPRVCVASPCHVARWDAPTGRCVEEPVTGGACRSACIDVGQCQEGVCVGQFRSCDDRDPCTSDRCDAFLGCVSTAMDEESVCGVATCEAMPVCRAGRCVTQPLAIDEADPRVCGLDVETVERPADPRRAAASLFVRDSGEVHLLGDDLFERRTDAGWIDASALIAGRGLRSFTPAGHDGYWAVSDEEIWRFDVRDPASLVCEMDGNALETVTAGDDTVWLLDDYEIERCDADGTVTGVGWYQSHGASVSVCDDDSLWVVDIEGGRHGDRLRDRDYSMQGGACVGDTLFGARGNGVERWTSEGWVRVGPYLSLPRGVTISAHATDDLWVRDSSNDLLHWDGRRFTRVGREVRAWVSPSPGEAWVLENDGTLVHRRRR